MITGLSAGLPAQLMQGTGTALGLVLRTRGPCSARDDSSTLPPWLLGVPAVPTERTARALPQGCGQQPACAPDTRAGVGWTPLTFLPSRGSGVWVAPHLPWASSLCCGWLWLCPGCGSVPLPSRLPAAWSVPGRAGVWLCLSGRGSVSVQLCPSAMSVAGHGPSFPAVLRRVKARCSNPQALS